MSIPTDRASFVEYCLRKLGKPVHQIHVDADQVDDRVDEALQYFYDYHMDGSERTYVKWCLSAQDIANQYITLPDNIIGAVQVFPVCSLGSYGTDMFNVRYQLALNELYTIASISMVPYYLAMEQLNLVSEMLVGNQPIRYSKHSGVINLDMDWSKVIVGEYLIIEAFQIIDPNTYSTVWGDRWLQNYATAKIKEQWGENISLYQGELPGGMRLNSERILNEAREDIRKMEAEMLSAYSMPPTDWIG